MVKYIWIKNKRYYHYEDYNTYQEARKIADYYKKKTGSRFFIIKAEKNFMFPKIVYKLYLSKITKIW